MATKKIRVYELARELGVENAVVLELAEELKVGVKSHSSSIDDPSADRVRRLADSRGLRREPIVEEPKPTKKEAAKKEPVVRIVRTQPPTPTPAEVAPRVEAPTITPPEDIAPAAASIEAEPVPGP